MSVKNVKKGLVIIMAKFTSAVILAAGNGTRFGGKVKKQYVEILGIPAVIRTIMAFEECDIIDEIILVGDKEALGELLSEYSFKKIAMVVSGGETRQESALLGFDSVSDKSKFVAIHDAARCLVTPEMIEATVKEAYKYRAAAAAHRSEDTVKIADKNGIVEKTTDRDKIWLVQTPQVFQNDVYRSAAYMAKKDDATVTDDCMLCERLGFEVKLCECGRENLKLTSPEDLMLCEAIIAYREKEKEVDKK
ncbi:MAG: 2-C-methyl-D-erythritol 4-phosphate cytidylyltransferase [Ruminococcaceae bacterium]|nr:2-C-methyl-D-erythritol 4-phosphate cytidylyltransferase [Oscillospiraceae bacterium]